MNIEPQGLTGRVQLTAPASKKQGALRKVFATSNGTTEMGKTSNTIFI
jgi:hypothetical protein